MILEKLHTANIIIHVFAGSVALLLGILALISRKGKKWHNTSGRFFLYSLLIVIITGLLGVFVFGRNTFLLVITVLSAYHGYSGYRVLKNKTNIFYIQDIIVALTALCTVLYFLYYFKKIGMIWSPVIIYSTVGYLFAIITYDFLRYFIPYKKYPNRWLYEHILKMTSAFSAILSAFTGTVFPDYKPYSQFLPSTLGILIAIGFMMFTFRRLIKFKKS